MAYADEQSYEEMIQALQKFERDVEEQCSAMASAGQDCVDNTDGDPAAERSNGKLQKCVGDIRGALESIQGIAAALQQELEEIREAAAKAASSD